MNISNRFIPPPPEDGSNATKRERSIRLAVFSSALSKSGTLLLRIVSIPIAIRVLGLGSFGVYASLTTMVALIEAFHIGVGPALTRGILKAEVAHDQKAAQAIFSTGFLIIAAITLTSVALFSLLFLNVPMTSLFGPHFAEYETVVMRCLPIAVGIIMIHVIFGSCEKARDGFMETSVNNKWGALGNYGGAIFLFLGIRYFHSIEFLFLAVNGSVALAKVGNAASLFHERPWLFPRIGSFDLSLVRPLLADSSLFSITYLLSALVEYNALVYLAGRFHGPELAAIFSAFVTIHFSLTGILQMFTIPLWPAVIDAHERGDKEWIQTSTRRLALFSVGFSAICAIGLALAGPFVMPLWLGEKLPLTPIVFVAFGIYFMLHIFRQSGQTLLLGIGKVSFCFRTILVESALVMTVIVAALKFGSPGWVYAGIAAAIAGVSGWIYPVTFLREIRK